MAWVPRLSYSIGFTSIRPHGAHSLLGPQCPLHKPNPVRWLNRLVPAFKMLQLEMRHLSTRVFTRAAETAQAIGRHRMQDRTSHALLPISRMFTVDSAVGTQALSNANRGDSNCFSRCPHLSDASQRCVFVNRGTGSASNSVKKMRYDHLPFLKQRVTLNEGIVSITLPASICEDTCWVSPVTRISSTQGQTPPAVVLEGLKTMPMAKRLLSNPPSSAAVSLNMLVQLSCFIPPTRWHRHPHLRTERRRGLAPSLEH